MLQLVNATTSECYNRWTLHRAGYHFVQFRPTLVTSQQRIKVGWGGVWIEELWGSPQIGSLSGWLDFHQNFYLILGFLKIQSLKVFGKLNQQFARVLFPCLLFSFSICSSFLVCYLHISSDHKESPILKVTWHHCSTFQGFIISKPKIFIYSQYSVLLFRMSLEKGGGQFNNFLIQHLHFFSDEQSVSGIIYLTLLTRKDRRKISQVESAFIFARQPLTFLIWLSTSCTLCSVHNNIYLLVSFVNMFTTTLCNINSPFICHLKKITLQPNSVFHN